MSSESEIDKEDAVERLRKYLERRDQARTDSAFEAKTYGAQKALTTGEPPCSAHHERNSSCKKLEVTNNSVSLDRKDKFEYSPAVSENDLSVGEHDSQSSFYTETDVILPFNLVKTSRSSVSEETVSCGGDGRNKMWHSPHGKAVSPGIGQMYQEMLEIYDKLQVERTRQCQWATQLQHREQQLQRREEVLLQHQNALWKIRQVEEEVRIRVQELKEQHQKEVKELNDALKEKAKEHQRVKSSFQAIKELNDTMKKQINEVQERNRRLENQSRRVQARLENLQRKCGYSVAPKGRGYIAPKCLDTKPSDPGRPHRGSVKGSTNSSVLKLLVLIIDWVSDSLLVLPGEEKETKRALGQNIEQTSFLQEKCSKVLPLLAEQLQMILMVDPELYVPLLKFMYWSLRHLDSSPKYNTLSSTFRRLGEEVYRGTSVQGILPELGGPVWANPSVLFKSPHLHTRLLSTLIIIKTVSQADILARALERLHDDLWEEEGQALFLQYRALDVVLVHVTGGDRGLLAPTVDVLLQMSTESRFLHSFLEACSTQDFFRSICLLLRDPQLDIMLLEKVSILLQKLSKIRKNKKLFELFAVHLMVQEMHRTVDPSYAFLAINLNSILFNLGMLKKVSVCSSPAHSL